MAENENAMIMSCHDVPSELGEIWQRARDISAGADMSDMDSALATMDMAAVQAVDEQASAFEARMAAESKTWQYFFRKVAPWASP